MNRALATGVLLLGLMWATALGADERIQDYQVDITINPDSSLDITESISVNAEGKAIRRGIYRDFPTDYRDDYGFHYKVRFEVLSVTRNSAEEDWFTERYRNGVRVYVGSHDRLLSHGPHRYELRYRTNRQLGYFPDSDELYFNAIGHGWAFPIDRARVRITVPGDLTGSEVSTAIYVGRYGAPAGGGQVTVNQRSADFEPHGPLQPGEGVTVALAFPKGLVQEPGSLKKLGWFLYDNRAALAALVGLLLMLTLLYRAWDEVGRDPRPGVIFPRYEPPKGLSPAACRYVMRRGSDRRGLTAALINLAVGGHITIEQDGKDYTIHKAKERRSNPSPGEQAVYTALLSGKQSLELDDEHHATFQRAQRGLKLALESEYKGKLFHTNGRKILPGLFTALIAGAIMLVLKPPILVVVIYVLVAIGLLFLFGWLLQAPTLAGRLVMDEIEGFQMYLETGERQRLQQMRSPELTPEVFERFLPYAFALDVQNNWSRAFRDALVRAGQEPGQPHYQPSWYNTSDTHSLADIGKLGSTLNSGLSRAIASASTPPGSSSGTSSGGGGFSGGGGGGGGGGGW